MATTPNSIITPQAVKTAYAVCTAANSDLDDSPGANVTPLLTAGVNGAVLYGLTALPRETVTATRLGLYLSKDNGTTRRLIRFKIMPVGTVSATAGPDATDFGYSESAPLRLEANDRLYVDIGVNLTTGIVFAAQYEDL